VVLVGGNTIFDVDIRIELVKCIILLDVVKLHICHRFEKGRLLPIGSLLVNQWAVNTLSLIDTGNGFFDAQGDTHD
jgi:hypothetical protein